MVFLAPSVFALRICLHLTPSSRRAGAAVERINGPNWVIMSGEQRARPLQAGERASRWPEQAPRCALQQGYGLGRVLIPVVATQRHANPVDEAVQLDRRVVRTAVEVELPCLNAAGAAEIYQPPPHSSPLAAPGKAG